MTSNQPNTPNLIASLKNNIGAKFQAPQMQHQLHPQPQMHMQQLPIPQNGGMMLQQPQTYAAVPDVPDAPGTLNMFGLSIQKKYVYILVLILVIVIGYYLWNKSKNKKKKSSWW